MQVFRWLTYFALTFTLIPATAYASSIEIKGLSIGLQKADVEQKFPNWRGFTIAGVPSKYPHSALHTSYVDEKLDHLLFFFEANSFTTMLSALKEKYPSLSCEESQVGNSMGAKFTQIDCALSDQLSVLRLSRFAGDVQTSSLSLISKRKMEEFAEKARKTKKDI